MQTPAAWDVRLLRAQHHLTVLRQETEAYIKSGSARIEVVSATAPRRLELRLRQTDPPPVWWSAAVGDYLHNPRSALDNLAWAIVQRHKTRSLTDHEQRGVLFPIVISPDEWPRASARRLPAVVNTDVLAAFRFEQPFAFTEDIPDFESDGNRFHPLARLQGMSNQDKHRTPAVVIAVPSMVSLGAPGDNVQFRGGDSWPWRDGSLIGSWLLPDAYADDEVHPGNELVVALAEGAQPLSASGIAETLAVLGNATAETVRRVSPWASGAD